MEGGHVVLLLLPDADVLSNISAVVPCCRSNMVTPLTRVQLQMIGKLILCVRVCSHRDAPGTALRCTYEGTLKDMLVCLKPRQPKRIYYQQLSIRINELENKRQVKVS